MFALHSFVLQVSGQHKGRQVYYTNTSKRNQTEEQWSPREGTSQHFELDWNYLIHPSSRDLLDISRNSLSRVLMMIDFDTRNQKGSTKRNFRMNTMIDKQISSTLDVRTYVCTDTRNDLMSS